MQGAGIAVHCRCGIGDSGCCRPAGKRRVDRRCYLQLQAEDMGLGSCWVQVRERFTASGMPSGEYVHEVLDIPLQLQVLSVIAIGHKGMERKPFNEDNLQWEKIHINKYGGK